MDYLNYSKEYLKTAGGYQTAMEINHQPEVWKLTAEKFFKDSSPIYAFIQNALKEVDQILLTGAGSSSFIGHSLSGILFKNYKTPCHVVPTTHIVSFPGYYFNAEHSCLIISFARSGESPESVAALELADRYSKKCFHLIITCDGKGALANYHSKNPIQVFTLPSEANDSGLAMTGSYTSMLLSGLLIALYDENSKAAEQLELSISITEKLIRDELKALKDISEKNFSRAVFLGSGPLYGTAMEAALKLQELTNGKVMCNSDTFLGFRHGPKAVINEETLVVYFFSNNQYAHQYELDLVQSMDKGNPALFQLGISEDHVDADQLNHQIHISEPGQRLEEDFQSLNYIVLGQILGFFKSMQLGLKPDMPSLNGAISRVVEGVHIYRVKT